MKQELTYTDASPKGFLQAKHSLYNSYAGMLLGYISEIVKNPTTAEQYLVDVFADLHPADVTEIVKQGNIFSRLQLLARKKLSGFYENLQDCTPEDKVVTPNKFISQMSVEQQLVFCGIHYHGKSTTKLATELDKTEEDIRKILKQSFTIIRSNRK